MERTDIVLLLDIYGDLLSKSQREALDMRYNCDLSLAEIAEETSGGSRQGVHYAVKNGEKRLEELESKLGFLGRMKTLGEQIDKAAALAEEIQGSRKDEQSAALIKLLREMKDSI